MMLSCCAVVKCFLLGYWITRSLFYLFIPVPGHAEHDRNDFCTPLKYLLNFWYSTMHPAARKHNVNERYDDLPSPPATPTYQ